MKRKSAEKKVPVDAIDGGIVDVISSLMRACRDLKDRCGRSFKIERKIERREDSALLRVARFDRLKFTDIFCVLGSAKTTDYAATGFEVHLGGMLPPCSTSAPKDIHAELFYRKL